MRYVGQSRIMGPLCALVVLPLSFLQGGCNRILKAEPGVIDYGNVFIGDHVTRSVVWTRPDPDEARVENVRLADSQPGFKIVTQADGQRVLRRAGPNAPQARVRFMPDQYRNYQATLVPILTSGAEAQPVRLTGQGIYVKQIDRLRLEGAGLSRSQPLDVGQVPVGGQTTHELTLTNLGSSPLRLKPHWRKADADFSIQDQPRTIRIPYGESKTIHLTFEPKHEGIHTDRLALTTSQDQIAGVVVIGVGKRR